MKCVRCGTALTRFDKNCCDYCYREYLAELDEKYEKRRRYEIEERRHREILEAIKAKEAL